MNNHVPDPVPMLHTLALKAGEQAVINGALVTAKSDCGFEICHSAAVFTGRRISATRAREPHIELYLSLSQVAHSELRFADARLRLFGLLSQIILEDDAPEIAEEIRKCTLALIGGKRAEAKRSAGAIAASQITQVLNPRAKTACAADRTAPMSAQVPGHGWKEAS
ncbi:hypothetical protein INR77_01975 [Erythrobacter sp. SCSIO 43205]|uniref:flagellar biosynthesis repressor FlbT n=1 Tax=Erythrobacter sp. SCSIO 43205 TaxID=2779361 RepID=UPI001CA85EA5|nr:flagellar biosynthesis repressor FlbT [Erythrobacter sp. SCSIO 43205]UAB78527.1 hypothetical protein INR77_01975 [Erythrobacter sp. SCSIO 43205]